MPIVHKKTYTAFFLDSDTKKENIESLEKAMEIAEEYCGNNAYFKIPSENTYFYGPGDGTTSAMIKQDINWEESIKKA
jgi:mevalonate pyrophosphate decarboxylase